MVLHAAGGRDQNQRGHSVRLRQRRARKIVVAIVGRAEAQRSVGKPGDQTVAGHRIPGRRPENRFPRNGNVRPGQLGLFRVQVHVFVQVRVVALDAPRPRVRFCDRRDKFNEHGVAAGRRRFGQNSFLQ